MLLTLHLTVGSNTSYTNEVKKGRKTVQRLETLCLSYEPEAGLQSWQIFFPAPELGPEFEPQCGNLDVAIHHVTWYGSIVAHDATLFTVARLTASEVYLEVYLKAIVN